MKRFVLALAATALLLAVPAQAQKRNAKNATPDNGGITTEMMQQMKKNYGGNASDKALRNIMVTNSPAKLALNYENSTAFDSHFSNRVESKAITDQKSSGRCWMFTGMNVLRPSVSTTCLPISSFRRPTLSSTISSKRATYSCRP